MKLLPEFFQLRKNLKKNYPRLKTIKLAVLGDSATQLIVQAIRGYGFEKGLNLDIFEANYNQIERQIFDSSSKLYLHNPEYLIIFHSSEKLRQNFYGETKENRLVFAETQLQKLSDLHDALQKSINCKVIYLNFPELPDPVFSNYASKVTGSFSYQVRRLNLELMNLCQEKENLFLVDLAGIYSRYGFGFLFDQKMYISSDMVFSIDMLPIMAQNIVNIILAGIGKFKKCLILDLDNTLWGGIIGDDGIEKIQIGELGIGKAFNEFQIWVRELKNRGIILAVCSKNTEHIAKEPFEKHPDMVLRLDDFALFVANWENKVDNIRHIQEVLNIGFDSMVFVDDNPFERNMVRESIPDITVPELPEDPVEYVDYLCTCNLFETFSHSDQDMLRTQQYQVEAQRRKIKKSFKNEDDYLKSLKMIAKVAPFDKFNIPRIAQLAQRSNQFNLRTVRYGEKEISLIAKSKSHIPLAFYLKDKFGDYGLISVVILEKRTEETFVDTWLMSCRVLNRRMERFVLDTIVDRVKQCGYRKIVGQYVPTEKNVIVSKHYENLGFLESHGNWALDISKYIINEHSIDLET